VEQPSDRRPGRPRDARVDAAIEDAAARCLAKHGFAGSTVEAIAAEAGVGKAAIYRRWPSREALLIDVASRDMPVIEVPDTGSLRNDLVAIFTSISKQMHESGPGQILQDVIAESYRQPELRDCFARMIEDRRQVVTTVVHRAKKRGELKKGIDADLVVDMINGPIFYRKMVALDPADTRYIRNLVDAVLGGVKD
jgi:AcrR family transcriptional regulator